MFSSNIWSERERSPCVLVCKRSDSVQSDCGAENLDGFLVIQTRLSPENRALLESGALFTIFTNFYSWLHGSSVLLRGQLCISSTLNLNLFEYKKWIQFWYHWFKLIIAWFLQEMTDNSCNCCKSSTFIMSVWDGFTTDTEIRYLLALVPNWFDFLLWNTQNEMFSQSFPCNERAVIYPPKLQIGNIAHESTGFIRYDGFTMLLFVCFGV